MKKVYIQPVVDTNDFATVSMLCSSPTGFGLNLGSKISDEYEVVGE